MDVPENPAIVTGLILAWQQDTAALNWHLIQDMHYLVQRGSKSYQLVVAGVADDPSFLDGSAEKPRGQKTPGSSLTLTLLVLSNSKKESNGDLTPPPGYLHRVGNTKEDGQARYSTVSREIQ